MSASSIPVTEAILTQNRCFKKNLHEVEVEVSLVPRQPNVHLTPSAESQKFKI